MAGIWPISLLPFQGTRMLAATARCFSTDGIWAQDSQFGMPLLNGLHASGVYQPQLATSVDHPPPRAGWIHEVKHDGYRTVLIIERHKGRAYTRNGFDWTDRYPGITKAAAKLDCRSAIIDGEVTVQDERGVSDFEALKSAIRWSPQRLVFG